jgi:hypothetical protein
VTICLSPERCGVMVSVVDLPGSRSTLEARRGTTPRCRARSHGYDSSTRSSPRCPVPIR